MKRWFRDYRWSHRKPLGVDELPAPPVGSEHYVWLELDNGVRIEQFDAAGRFVRVCHSPEDALDRTWQREDLAGDGARVFRDARGAVVRFETYDPTGERCGSLALLRGRMYNADGRLLLQHDPRRISETAYDIHVADGTGRHQVIIHHANVDRGEPFLITEDWAE